jgi:arrestin-related trafficking adapter 4/5/7
MFPLPDTVSQNSLRNMSSLFVGRLLTAVILFRLDNDFIVFRGNEHESSGQLLKGTLVLCLPAALKVEDIHLRLTGILQLGYVCKVAVFATKLLSCADNNL